MTEKSPHTEITTATDTDRELLSGEELGFLRELFAAQKPDTGDLTDLELSTSSEALLGLFPGLKGLEVSAERGGYRYVFPLQSVHSSGLKLEIKTPRIYDLRGSAVRSWRAPVEDTTVEVTDPGGMLKDPRVVNLSMSGLLLVADGKDAAFRPERHDPLPLQIKLPDLVNPKSLSGRVVRRTIDKVHRRQSLAIEFETLDLELEEAICHYLLRAHRVQHQAPIAG